jgi:signal peptidase I
MDTETERTETAPGRRWPRLVLLILGGLLLVLVANWQVERFALEPYRIPSSAMEPTLHCPRPAPGCEADTADRIVVARFAPFWTPSRGDLVAFTTPQAAQEKCGVDGTFVKRVIGLPGERVSIRVRRGAAFVSIDGEQLDEPYIENERRGTGPEDTFRVPDGQYFVMGDNRSQSCDSRVFGAVPRDDVIGPVVARYWPLDRIGTL